MMKMNPYIILVIAYLSSGYTLSGQTHNLSTTKLFILLKLDVPYIIESNLVFLMIILLVILSTERRVIGRVSIII